MRKLIATLLLITPMVAGAQTATPDYDAYSEPPIPQPQGEPPAPPDVTPGPPVTEPAQPEQAPEPYVQQSPVPPPAPSPSGQWVYTSQYGWIWMPYGNAYTYLPAGGVSPDMYVYYPSFGWTWVVAPWVWGLGPRPYFGFYGYTHFVWYGRGFGRWYAFAPRYVTWGPRGYWGGGRWIAPHAVYPRVVPQYAAPHTVTSQVVPRYAPSPVAPRYAAPRPAAPQVGPRYAPSRVAPHYAAARPAAPHVVGRGGFGGGPVGVHGGHR